MKIIGIVAEYNPFHNGHLYQINTSVQELKADGVVVIMSGNFVQRGKPALFDKWTRAKAAVASGANLVLELPTYFATSSAELFAHGAISLLNATGCVDYLSFGSESDCLNTLWKIAKLLSDEPDHYKSHLKAALKEGHSFPKAREDALKKCMPLELSINKPNFILGIEYLKSLQRNNSSIEPFVVKRKGSGYHDMELNTTFASATAIREAFWKSKCLTDLDTYMPAASIQTLQQAYFEAVEMETFEQLLLYKLRSCGTSHLHSLRDYSEGIENRVVDAAQKSCTYTELVENIKTKRYAETRINRLLLSALLDLPALPFDPNTDGYLRVLATDDIGKKILKKMKKTATLPIITNINKIDHNLKKNPLLQIDTKASDLYALGQTNKIKRKGGLDYITNVVQL